MFQICTPGLYKYIYIERDTGRERGRERGGREREREREGREREGERGRERKRGRERERERVGKYLYLEYINYPENRCRRKFLFKDIFSQHEKSYPRPRV